MKRRIDRYKVSCWYDRDRNVPVFGIKVRVDGSWFNLAEAGRALFFDERRDAEAVVSVFTAQSQSRKAMGHREFQESKDKVLDYIAGLIGVDRADVPQSEAA